MIRSTSSQDDESVFLDEDDDPTFSIATINNNDSTNEKINSFFTENYDHENVKINTNIDNEVLSSNEIQRRKSVSARFRSISREIITTDTLSTSVNSTQEDISTILPTTSHRLTKYIRSQTTLNEPKIAQPKSSTIRKTRTNRTRSEDRFRRSSLSLMNSTTDTTSPSHSQLPSYAAHTSSSISKLREGTPSSIPPSAPVLSSVSNISLTNSSQTRHIPSAIVPSDTRSTSSNKNLIKSRSIQNLILPISTITNSGPRSKMSSTHRVKISRRPPNLPTATTILSSSSSSSSSSTSSPTKTQQHFPPSTQESVLLTHELNDTPNDLMPKWAQDCFYRTVVLGLKPLLLQDIPSSTIKTMKHSSSTCSIESSDSLETASELQACKLNTNQKEMKVRRSISIPDYKQLKPLHHVLPTEKTMNKEEVLIKNDHRMPIINHLVGNLHKRLDDLENLHSTVSQSSDTRDLMLKQYIEQIFTDLHVRITNHHQQQNITSIVVTD